MAYTKIRMQGLTKLQKSKYQILSCQFVLKQFFVFPEHFAYSSLCVAIVQ